MDINPFQNPPATAQWGRAITHADYNKMLQDFQPKSMGDEWTVITNTPEDAQGNIIVHAYFGVKNNEEHALTIAAGDPNETDAKGWATITKISWKAKQPGASMLSCAVVKGREAPVYHA